MPFDITTATPDEQQTTPQESSSGFDIKTATPVDDQDTNSIVHLADKNMTIEHPSDMPDHQVINAMRDHVYGNDQTPSVPEEGQKPFVQGMVDKLSVGYANGIAGMAKILGVDHTEFMKSILLTDEEKAFANSGTQTKNPYKEFAYHFADGAGGLLSTLPLFAATGEAAAGTLMSRVPAVVAGVLSKIPNFAIGAGIFGAAKGAEDKASQGPLQAVGGAAQGGGEALFWNTLYGKVGGGVSMFPKMIAINNAQATYEAAKQNRLPTTKELYTATADGIAYGAVFAVMPHLSNSTPSEKPILDKAYADVNKAIVAGDHPEVQKVYEDLLENPNLALETRKALKSIYDQTKSETLDQANTMMGLNKEGQNAEERGGEATQGSGEEGTNGQGEDGVHLRDDGKTRLASESGQINADNIPGFKGASEAITNAKDFIQRSQEMTPKAQEVEAGLNDLESQNKADEISAYKYIENLPDTAKDNSAVFKHADELEVFGKSKTELTPEQQKSYDENLKPLQQAADAEYAKIVNNGIPLGREGHLPRFVAGKGSIFDRLKAGIKSIQQGGLLTKTSGNLKERTMKALTSEEGGRTVASVKGDVTAFNGKVATDLGKFKTETYQKLRDAEIKNLDDKAKDLNKEYSTLTETSKRMKSSPQRIRNIEQELVDLDKQKEDVIQKYANKDLTQEVFTDKNGKRWTIGNATTEEIEKNTNLTYHKNPYLNVMASYLKMRQINRAMDFIENLKSDPDFTKAPEQGGIAVKYENNPNAIPDGWRGVNMPQFRGYAFEPRIADALDNFYKKIQTGSDDPLQALTAINKFLRAAIFYNPAMHVPNIGLTWAVDRGFTKWFIPKNYDTLTKTGLRAIEAVTKQNKDYIDWIENGGNGAFFDASGNKIGDLIMKKMGEEIKENGPLAENLSKALGYANPKKLIKAIYDTSSKATWWVDDVLNMQRDLERMHDNPDMTMKEAREQTSKFIPDYKIPSRVGPGPLKSKILADALKNQNTTMFGAYHYGLLKSYANMVHSLIDVRKDPKAAAETIDKLLMLGVISFAVYPALDKAVQKILGNDKASVHRFGLATLPDNTYHFVKGDKNLASYAMGIMTPAPLLKSGVELVTNNKLPYGGAVSKTSVFKDPAQFGKDMAQYAEQQVAPLNQAEAIASGKRTIGETALGLAGIKSPHQSEQSAHAELKSKIVDDLIKGDDSSLNKAIEKGDISESQAAEIQKEAEESPIERTYKHLSLERVLTKADSSIDKMTDADKNSLKTLIDDKYGRIQDQQKQSPNKIKKLGELLDKFYKKHKLN